MSHSSSPDLLADIHTKPRDVRHDTRMIGWPAGTESPMQAVVTSIPPSQPQPDVVAGRKRRRSTTNETDRAPINPSHASSHKSASKLAPNFSRNAASTANASDIWSTFRPGFQVDFGDGYFQWAMDRANPSHTVLVQRLERVDRVLTHERLSRLPHRHFVKFHGLYPAGASTNVVFEYMRLSLVQVIGVPRPLTEQEQRAIVGQLVRSLQAAHKVGISGFDLKLSRIWLNWRGEIKILPQITCDSRSVSSSAAQTSERDLSGPEKDVHRLGEVLQQLSEHVKLMKASTVPPDGQAQSQGPELLQFITDANAGDLEALNKHPLLTPPWSHTDLIELAQVACMRSKVYVRDLDRYGE